MGRSLIEASHAARAAFSQADSALSADSSSGLSLSTLCFEGPLEQLTLTENTQPAILATSYAAFCALEERLEGKLTATAMAGHSLGEYSALVAAGALDFASTLKLVRLRGRAMQEAVAPGVGAMAAVMGLDPEAIERCCKQAESESEGTVVSPANFNAPGQVVIAGHAAAVARASELCSNERGRVIPLKVSAPFHCALMKPAGLRLQQALESVTVLDAKVPVVANVDGSTLHSASSSRALLVAQVAGAVRWEQCVATILAQGVSTFVEIGPGRVLSGLLKRIHKSAQLFNVSDAQSLDATAKALLAL